MLFSANPQSRSAYQSLFPNRQIDKHYQAIARALPDLQFPLVHKSRMVVASRSSTWEVEGQSNSETLAQVLEKNGKAVALRVVAHYRQDASVARAHGCVGRLYLQRSVLIQRCWKTRMITPSL